MTTGEKIAALRREHKLSQEALGEKLGLSRQAVSKWEADQAVPTMDNLMELSRLFGVPVDTLLRPDAPFPAPLAEENSTDAPAAPETPHKGVSPSHRKILAIGGAALLCVSLALNAVCLYQIAQLKGEAQAAARAGRKRQYGLLPGHRRGYRRLRGVERAHDARPGEHRAAYRDVLRRAARGKPTAKPRNSCSEAASSRGNAKRKTTPEAAIAAV